MGNRRRKNDFETSSWLGILGKPFQMLANWFSSFGGDDRIRSEEGWGARFVFLLWPLKLLIAIFVFMISSWTVSRRGWPFILGMPAFLGMLGGMLALWLHNYFAPRLIDRSQLYYEKFLIDEAWGPNVAQHFAAKRVSQEPDNLDAKFQLATVWSEVGKTERAEDLMRFLASQNVPRAHLWFARKYLASNPVTDDQQSYTLARQHIDDALESEPDNPTARALLANYYLLRSSRLSPTAPEHREYVENAAEQLEFIFQSGSAEAYWQLPNLIRSLVALDKPDQARRSFEQARRALGIYLRRSPDDRLVPTIWSTLIRSALQLKDYRLAKVLVEDAKRQSSNPAWSQDLVRFETLIALEEAKSFSLIEELPQRMDVLSRMLAKSPNNRLIAEQLMEALVSLTDSEDKNLLLEQSKLSTPNPEIVHLLLGISKVAEGEIESAKTHWRIATHSSTENSQLALVSLMNVVLVRYNEQFPNFIDMVALAMEMFPQQGLFYEVRGAFHKQNQRFQEAIADFQYAVEVIPSPKNFPMHIHLIQCYEKLGDTEQADNHRRALQAIMNKVNPADRQFMEDLIKQSEQAAG